MSSLLFNDYVFLCISLPQPSKLVNFTPKEGFFFPQISPNLCGYLSFGDQIMIKGEIEAQKLSDFMGNSTRYVYKCTFESQIIILVVLTTISF
jgi:hypothetical protein